MSQLSGIVFAVVRDIRNHHGDLLPVMLREYQSQEMAECWAEGHQYQYSGLRVERWQGVRRPVIVREFEGVTP